jgi:NAD(P)-dependent dehydrogenase (short-subunit alcohol dehydrogenase family)
VNRHSIGVRRGSRRGHGIGAATASAFAQRDDVVAVSGRHDDVSEHLAGRFERASAADSLFVHADVWFEREVADLISVAVKSFGRARRRGRRCRHRTALGAHRRADRNALRENVRNQRAENVAVDET